MGNREGDTNAGNDVTATKITQMVVVAIMGSMLGNTYASTHVPVHSKVSSAINQLLANQAALYQQMAALSFHAPPLRNSMFQVPLIQTLTIPGIPPPFAVEGFTSGRSAQGSRGHECGCGRGGRGRKPFADHLAGCGGGGVSLAATGGGIPPFQQVGTFPQMGQ